MLGNEASGGVAASLARALAVAWDETAACASLEHDLRIHAPRPELGGDLVPPHAAAVFTPLWHLHVFGVPPRPSRWPLRHARLAGGPGGGRWWRRWQCYTCGVARQGFNILCTECTMHEPVARVLPFTKVCTICTLAFRVQCLNARGLSAAGGPLAGAASA